jgi:hypothetical protein
MSTVSPYRSRAPVSVDPVLSVTLGRMGIVDLMRYRSAIGEMGTGALSGVRVIVPLPLNCSVEVVEGGGKEKETLR